MSRKMLSVTYESFMLSVVMLSVVTLNVIMMSVVAPFYLSIGDFSYLFQKKEKLGCAELFFSMSEI